MTDPMSKALAIDCNPVVLTMIESTLTLAVLDVYMAWVGHSEEDKILLQSARDKIFLSMPREFSQCLPEESEL